MEMERQALSVFQRNDLFRIGRADGRIIHIAVADGEEHAAELFKIVDAVIGHVPALHHAADALQLLFMLFPLLHRPVSEARKRKIDLL